MPSGAVPAVKTPGFVTWIEGFLPTAAAEDGMVEDVEYVTGNPSAEISARTAGVKFTVVLPLVTMYEALASVLTVVAMIFKYY